LSKDDIGDRGQWQFSLMMTELCGRDEPIFRPRFLGDKYPTFDFIVELVDQYWASRNMVLAGSQFKE
jgi:hypothetical protein